jgi:hypothetical protein
MTDINLLKAITDEKNRGASPKWEAARAVERVLRLMYDTPQGNALWKPLYDEIAAAYGLIADWGDETP